MEEMPAFKPVFKPLLEQAAGVMITIVAIGFILGTWMSMSGSGAIR